MIKYINKKPHYYDKHGKEIQSGDIIRWPSGKEEKVYRTEQGYLGTDATNPKWIETGRAEPCDFGIYPFEDRDTDEIEVVS